MLSCISPTFFANQRSSVSTATGSPVIKYSYFTSITSGKLKAPIVMGTAFANIVILINAVKGIPPTVPLIVGDNHVVPLATLSFKNIYSPSTSWSKGIVFEYNAY